MSDLGWVIDQPEQIEAFRILAIYHGLRMEVEMGAKYGCPPQSLPTRGLALRGARRTLQQYGFPGPSRTRKECLGAMRALCMALELIPIPEEEHPDAR